jgi:hypothetical protein
MKTCSDYCAFQGAMNNRKRKNEMLKEKLQSRKTEGISKRHELEAMGGFHVHFCTCTEDKPLVMNKNVHSLSELG